MNQTVFVVFKLWFVAINAGAILVLWLKADRTTKIQIFKTIPTTIRVRAALLQTSKLELPAANVRVRFGVRPQSEAAAVMPAQVKARTKTVVGVDGDASVALTCKVTPPFGPELPERLGGVAFLPTARMLMIKFPAKGCPEEVGSKVTVLALAPEKTHAEVEDQMRQLVQQTPMLHPLPVRADAPGKNADCPTLDG